MSGFFPLTSFGFFALSRSDSPDQRDDPPRLEERVCRVAIVRFPLTVIYPSTLSRAFVKDYRVFPSKETALNSRYAYLTFVRKQFFSKK